MQIIKQKINLPALILFWYNTKKNCKLTTDKILLYSTFLNDKNNLYDKMFNTYSNNTIGHF